MFSALPLMLVPFALYNIAMFGLIGIDGPDWLETSLVDATMVSGATWSLSVGDVLLLVALAMLVMEVLKATRAVRFQVLDHILSLIVFVAFLVEFLLFASAATSVFFLLTVIAFIDVTLGVVVSLKSASRDVSIGLR